MKPTSSIPPINGGAAAPHGCFLKIDRNKIKPEHYDRKWNEFCKYLLMLIPTETPDVLA
jgi:hypothetical protein